MVDVFKEKLIKRGQSLKILEIGEPRTSGKEVKIDIDLKEGIAQEQAKKVSQADPRRRPQGRQGARSKVTSCG